VPVPEDPRDTTRLAAADGSLLKAPKRYFALGQCLRQAQSDDAAADHRDTPLRPGVS
jgi:hypothetical protein